MSLLGSDMRIRLFDAKRAGGVALAAALVTTALSWAVHCLPVARTAASFADAPHVSCAQSVQRADGAAVARSFSDAGLDSGGQYAALAAVAEPGVAFCPTAGPRVTPAGRPTFFVSHRFLI